MEITFFIKLSNLSTLRVPDDGGSGNASCALLFYIKLKKRNNIFSMSLLYTSPLSWFANDIISITVLICLLCVLNVMFSLIYMLKD